MTEEQKKFRAAVMELTADLREDMGRTQDQLRKVRAEIAEIRYPCPRLTRLGDLDWDLTARAKMLDRALLARVKTYRAGQSA